VTRNGRSASAGKSPISAGPRENLDALKAQTPSGIDPDAVESAADTINALAAKLNDAVSYAQAALAPTPATTGTDARPV
jgi:hypothetical protein